jgi:hypothetical protein
MVNDTIRTQSDSSHFLTLATSFWSDWLVKDKYSIADIANFCWVKAAWMIDIDLNEFPGVKAWVDRINAREPIQKGLKVGVSKTEDEMKQMFAGVSHSHYIRRSPLRHADWYVVSLLTLAR